jgi:hypothetical protein
VKGRAFVHSGTVARWTALPLLAALALPTGAAADTVTFPLVVDYELVVSALRDQLHADATGTAVVWGESGGCRSLVLHDLAAGRAGDRVRVEAGGKARAGFGVLGFCFSPLTWDGVLQTLARPVVGPDWKLRLRELDSAVLGPDRERTAIASRAWDLVRDRFEERVLDVAFDLAPPADETKALLEACVPPERQEAARAALDSLRPTHTQVEDDGIRVTVAVDVPAGAAPAPHVAETPLTPEEIARWQEALDRWDGFLTFVVKGLGMADADVGVRDALLDILLESRNAVLSALAEGPRPDVDPVRKLFLDSWDRLRVVVRDAMRRKQVTDRALRYTAFLAAGDALAALDTVGNGLGLDVSADGLRRLARILDPATTTDPLAYSEDTDQDLRSLFGFHEPDTGEPLREEPIPAPEPGTWWPGARAAVAAEAPAPELAKLVKSVDRWVPGDAELDTYRDVVGRLLTAVAERERQRSGVGDRFAELYRKLVPSVAWQESCWRQFVRQSGAVTFLLSSTGDVGIMQVNRRVWRGFFDVPKLEWDTTYNMGAGAEILARLLDRYGSREAADRLDNAARATYSAYNGGPAAYRRYRATTVARTDRAVDRAFWEKYQAMAAGQALDFVLCTESWGTTPRS